MGSRAKKINNASFNGVPFLYESEIADRGQKLAIKNYWYSSR
jgi:prophage DNA circulation protein